MYFDEINNFFKYFEKKFKIKIIICLHPRVNKIELCKKYFNNRKCLIDKSHHLVSNCRYVFLHPSTTALNLPIIYKKSAIFLISNELLKQLEWKARIDRRKSILNQHFINISHFEDYNYPKNFNTLHEEGYKKYMREFISSEKNNFQRNIWGDFHRYAN